MVTLRIIHAKNQPPRPKTVAYKQMTHTLTQTDRQTEKVNNKDPLFEKEFFLHFYFLLEERSNNNKVHRLKSRLIYK